MRKLIVAAGALLALLPGTAGALCLGDDLACEVEELRKKVADLEILLQIHESTDDSVEHRVRMLEDDYDALYAEVRGLPPPKPQKVPPRPKLPKPDPKAAEEMRRRVQEQTDALIKDFQEGNRRRQEEDARTRQMLGMPPAKP